MMQFEISLADIVAFFSVLCGGGGVTVLTLKQKGLITFGKPTERRKTTERCIYHDELHKNIIEVKDIVKEVNKKADSTNLKLEKHLSYHVGKNDNS